MIRSMTGYASEFLSTDQYDVTMELKSLNSRYFEFKLKTGAAIDEWENEIKNIVYERLRRGKIDLHIRIVEKEAGNYKVVVNYELARKYEEALRTLSKRIKVIPKLSLIDFISIGNILQVERIGGYENLYEILVEMLKRLLDKIIEMMAREGEKTCEDIEKSVLTIEQSLNAIERLYPESLEKFKKASRERLLELAPEVLQENLFNSRLLMETEMLASRIAINEEIVRLKSHIQHFLDIMKGKIGGDSKKLDFICQEMNREANTISSKSNDYQIIENTIIMKGEIEKIREQLRNLE